MEKYYVYEWIRLDTNEPFYVGKGKADRCFTVRKRNKYFTDVLKFCEKNFIDVAVAILESGLTNEEALMTECWYINKYICDYGYNITNQTWGGDGGDVVSMMSLERKKEYSQKMRASCLGKNKGHFHTEESKLKMSEKKKGMYIGDKNPMYRKDVKDFMTDEKIVEWRNNIRRANIGKKHTEEAKRRIGQEVRRKVKGSLNEKSFLFDSVEECKEYFFYEYGVSFRFIQKIINSNKVYYSNRRKYKMLNGLFLEKYK